MNTCGTCKYFGKAREFDWYDSETEAEGTITKFHICDLLNHLNSSSKSARDFQNEPAGAIDGSGYYAAFCVSEEFGCNQWAPRSADQPEGDV